MPDTLSGLILCTFIMSKYVTYLASLPSLSERFSLMLVLPVLPGIIILFVSLVVVLPGLPGIIILFVSLVIGFTGVKFSQVVAFAIFVVRVLFVVMFAASIGVNLQTLIG